MLRSVNRFHVNCCTGTYLVIYDIAGILGLIVSVEQGIFERAPPGNIEISFPDVPCTYAIYNIIHL